jgi:predicted anti-sigma-YlaC factor YlaD
MPGGDLTMNGKPLKKLAVKGNNPIYVVIFIFLSTMVFNACSIKKMAMNTVADALTTPGSGSVFSGDNDPELVGDALPFAIKMYESLLVANPGHRGLQLKTGSLYIMYANAFLQTPANMLPEEEYKEQEFLLKRAKNLYLRGRDILLDALERKHPGFRKNLDQRKFDQALGSMKKDDVRHLYWAGAGWMGAFALDPFDMKLGLTLPGAAALMECVLKLDKNFGEGSIHDFYILYYGSLPDYMGGDVKKAREHFKKSIKNAEHQSASPYISLATTVSVKEQNVEEFTQLLKKALEIDPEADPDNRLVNILNQRKARWLLEHVDDYFLPKEPEEEDNNFNQTQTEEIK